MKGYLLDTHALMWAINEPSRLGGNALEGHVRRLGAEFLPIEWSHARLSGQLEWSHRDPFDRMLAAQAMYESLALVTRDLAFEELSGVTILW